MLCAMKMITVQPTVNCKQIKPSKRVAIWRQRYVLIMVMDLPKVKSSGRMRGSQFYINNLHKTDNLEGD